MEANTINLDQTKEQFDLVHIVCNIYMQPNI